MSCMRNEAPRGLRWGLFFLATIVALAAVSTDDAGARRRQRATSSYSPAYAAIVVDANSGAVLHSANADALRHPASLTKIPDAICCSSVSFGKLKLDNPLRCDTPPTKPTKLGLKEGSTIIEDAIKGMVRAGNDAAVVWREESRRLGMISPMMTAKHTRRSEQNRLPELPPARRRTGHVPTIRRSSAAPSRSASRATTRHFRPLLHLPRPVNRQPQSIARASKKSTASIFTRLGPILSRRCRDRRYVVPSCLAGRRRQPATCAPAR